jgi:hypothetical protein
VWFKKLFNLIGCLAHIVFSLDNELERIAYIFF